MWYVTWQTGVAYLIFGTIYLSAHRTLVATDWQGWHVATTAATGMLGWALLVSGSAFLAAVGVKRLLSRSTRPEA